MNDLSSTLRQEQEQNDRNELLATMRKVLEKVESLEKQIAALKKPAKAE